MSETNQGLLVHNWAPQLEILSHPATRAFAYNSKMLVEEMGVSVELKRGVQSNVVAEEVRRVIDLVVDESGKGGEMRRRAGEIKDKIRGAVGEDGEATGSSAEAMDDFVSALLSHRQGGGSKSSNSITQ
ncbi:hypothetical protein M0R45_019928 [Rubus argutus]|uniref:Uncharacterized protein n=1 Tax=Rubus argutus TaxID=59490 RepID=A0AAW1X8I0_RUBAR